MHYEIYVTTSDINDAGTDANVFIDLYGDQNISQDVYLDNPNHNDFERGNTDRFYVHLPLLGTINRVCIRHDNTGHKPGWHLSRIRVESGLGEEWIFHFHQWLALDEYPNQLSACRNSYRSLEEESQQLWPDFRRPWPDWPALQIQEWLKFDLNTKVYYHFFKFSKARAILVMKTKREGNFVVKVEERLWPAWPTLEIQAFLDLALLTEVDYDLVGPEDKPWYTVVEKAGEMEIFAPEIRQAIDEMLTVDDT